MKFLSFVFAFSYCDCSRFSADFAAVFGMGSVERKTCAIPRDPQPQSRCPNYNRRGDIAVNSDYALSQQQQLPLLTGKTGPLTSIFH